MRDFVNSRVINGKQQITVSIDFHTYQELIMWPYGYTFTDVPADMIQDDRDAMAAIGQAMAATNGYTPQQSSDLYITDGGSETGNMASTAFSPSSSRCIRRLRRKAASIRRTK